MAKISGSCLCGAVKYEGEAEPQVMVNCHCEDCRKSSASGHMSLMMVSEADVVFSGPVSSYEITADSGAKVTHNFCPICGSQMYNTNENMKGVKVLVAATLDDPELFTPQATVYASRALSWDQPAAHTRLFEEMPPSG